MSRSELVTQEHLQKKALIYIRQSTPHQQISNQESLRLQYALQERAQSLGWQAQDVEIIDADLGLTGASAQHRTGFQELVAKVTLGQVGIILSVDVTRLSRNCSDWYPLLDVCGYRCCLIADNDGIYDPGSANGRLLLGLKGQLSELELHTMRARMTAGLLNKAKRGELALMLPVGLVRDAIDRVHKDPNQEIQDRLNLIFTTFLRLRSASKVLGFLNAHDLGIPRRDRYGDVIWKKPTGAAILQILKNPAYAGAFVYGRTRSVRRDAISPRSKQIRLPIEAWKFRVNDVYPAYVSWEVFEHIQSMLLDNYAEYDRNKTRGVPRPGAALLHGMVYCGECGHKLVVQYKGGTRYLCNFLRQKYRVPVCQHIPGDAVDPSIVEAFFQTLSPIELDVYSRAVAAKQETANRVSHAHHQHLERLRYEATLAERQFLRVDPDNRLVASALETRWNDALAEFKRAEEAVTQHQEPSRPLIPLSEDLQTAFRAIGQHLPTLWRQGLLSQPQKKALLRCLIDKVVLHRPSPEWVQARIVWRGGETTTLQISVPVGSLKDLAGAEAMERLVLERSAQGIADEVIASELTGQGYRSPMHPFVLPSTVKITKDVTTHLYLFPDEPATLEGFRQLVKGAVKKLNFSRGHQDA